MDPTGRPAVFIGGPEDGRHEVVHEGNRVVFVTAGGHEACYQAMKQSADGLWRFIYEPILARMP